MNKKFLSAILFGAMLATSAGTFVSCKDYDDDINNLQTQIDKNSSAIAELQKLVGSGKWVSSISSIENGFTVTMSDGSSHQIKGINGKDGADGKDGAEWTIGEDGFWYVDGEKTGNVAVAKDGKNGITAPAPYIGENGNWVVYTFDAEKGEFVAEETEISAQGTSAYAVKANGVYTLFIADENGELQEIALPATSDSFVVNVISTSNFVAHFSYGEWKTPTKKADKEMFDKLAAEFPALKEYKDKDFVTQGNKLPFIVSPANMEFTEDHTFALVDSKGNDAGATLSNPTAGMPEEIDLLTTVVESRSAEGSAVWSVEYLPALNKKGTAYVGTYNANGQSALYSLVVTGPKGVSSATPFAYSYTVTEADDALSLTATNITKTYNEEGIDIFASTVEDPAHITLPADVLKGMYILEATDPAQVEEYGVSIEGSVVTIADMPKGKSIAVANGIKLKLTAISVNGSVDEVEFKLGVNNEIAATGALADQEVVLTGTYDKNGKYSSNKQTIWWSLEDLELSALQLREFIAAPTKTLVITNEDAVAVYDHSPVVVYESDKKTTVTAAKNNYTKAAYISAELNLANVNVLPGNYDVVFTATNANSVVILKAVSELTLVNPEEELITIKEAYLDENGVVVAAAYAADGYKFNLDNIFDKPNYSIASYVDVDREYDLTTYAVQWLNDNYIGAGIVTDWTKDPLETEVDKVRTIKVTYNLFNNAKNQMEKEIQVKWASPIYAEDATDVITMTASKLKIKFDEVTAGDKKNQIDFKAITTAVWAEGGKKGTEYTLFGTAASGGGSKYTWVDYQDYAKKVEGATTYPLTSGSLPIAIDKNDLVKFGMSVDNYKKYVDMGSDAPVIYLTAGNQNVYINLGYGQSIQATLSGWTNMVNAYLKYYEADKTGTGAYSLKKVYADNTNFDITKVEEYTLISLFNTYKEQLVFKSKETGAVTQPSGAVARQAEIQKVVFQCANEADNGIFFTLSGATSGDFNTAAKLTAKPSANVNVNLLSEGKKVIPMEMVITDKWGKEMTYEFEVEISL